MDWLVPSIVASLTGSFVLASVFVYLAVTEREACLRSWAAAWVVYGFRLAFDLAGALQPSVSSWTTLLAAAAAITYGMLLLKGTLEFVEAPVHVGLLTAGGAIALIATIAASAAGASLTLISLPGYSIQALAHLATGVAWWRSRAAIGTWARITAIGFVVWGIHKFDYPFVRGIEAVAPFGFILGAVLALIVALGALVAYFERTRHLLAGSEERYRALFEDSASVMLVIDPDTRRIVDANRSAEAFYGWTHAELTSMRIEDINTLSPDEIQREMAEARGRNRYSFRFKHRLASGDVRDVEVFSGPVPGMGHDLLYSIVHDVTERVKAERELAESEERYRTSFSMSEQPMLLVDPVGGRIIEANDAAATLYGYPASTLHMMSVADLTDDPPALIESEIAATVGEGKHVGAYRHRRADGTYRDVEVYATPLRFGGRVLIYTIVHDVTQRSDAERALAEYQRNLEELVDTRTADLRETMERLAAATRAKDDFLASMSHELRTPLNSVIGFAHLLDQELPGPLNAEQHKQIAMVERAGQHLLMLVNQVLDLSRIEAGRIDVDSAAVDAVELAAHIVESLSAMALERGLTLVLEEQRPTMVTTDPRLVEQILWNLVGNALKYTAEGEVRLRVERVGGEVRFVVTDSGPGMTAEQLERAFDRFSRFNIHNGTGGSGLGLNISLRLAEHLGGRIEAVSTMGEGSTFTLVLPCGESE